MSIPSADRMKMPWHGLAMSLLLFLVMNSAAAVQLTPQQALQIGKKIWQNECAGTVDGLTSWNRGEDFASLGIAHFIWYPQGENGPFAESFPGLLVFLQQQGVEVPAWLREARYCPWPDRDSFMADFQSPRMRELRQLLADTVAWQAVHAAQRLEAALPKMLESAPPCRHAHIKAQFHRMLRVPHGVYCLVDYVNFKGEGVRLTERYQGEGWGLLQVLEQMQDGPDGDAALREFSRAATEVLRRRVALSPPQRNEQRWMAGWENRCKTYLP